MADRNWEIDPDWWKPRATAAATATIIRNQETQAIVAIILEPYGDDSRVHERNGNPQGLSHNAETAENPNRVWTFKKTEPV
jgi:hypothetical protein